MNFSDLYFQIVYLCSRGKCCALVSAAGHQTSNIFILFIQSFQYSSSRQYNIVKNVANFTFHAYKARIALILWAIQMIYLSHLCVHFNVCVECARLAISTTKTIVECALNGHNFMLKIRDVFFGEITHSELMLLLVLSFLPYFYSLLFRMLPYLI